MTPSTPQPGVPAGTTRVRRSQHPGLDALLEKLFSRGSLSDDDVRVLRRHLEDLESQVREERDESAQIESVVGPAHHGDELAGYATADGGRRLAQRSPAGGGFHRRAHDLVVSDVGIGTYRGAADGRTDAAYGRALDTALGLGINLIDTSLNYRNQRSERTVGAALRRFVRGGGRRDEVVVCTKGGYLVRHAFTSATVSSDNVVPAAHCIAPAFLADQLARSRQNLGVRTIDVYYVHNPEVQLHGGLGRGRFNDRLRAAFETLEGAVAAGFIRYYGVATWHGYTTEELSLEAMEGLARDVAGRDHHFRFTELPFNLGMQEALDHTARGQSVLELAADLDVAVVGSASLLQSRLSRHLPVDLRARFPDLWTDAQRALQFARSTPGLTSVLVGMRDYRHVVENMAVSRLPRLGAAVHRAVAGPA